MSHTFYIAASYAVAALIIVILCLSVWMDGRARQRELAELERAGHRRRSTAAKAGAEAGGEAA